MRKEILFLILIIISLNTVYAVSCSQSGALWWSAHCSNSACTTCNTATASTRCQNINRFSTCTANCGSLGYCAHTDRGTCSYSWTCSNIVTSTYRCNGGNQERLTRIAACSTFPTNTYLDSSAGISCTYTNSWSVSQYCTCGCSGTTCISNCCTSHATSHCYDGDLYFYNSCNVRETINETCADGCANDACYTNDAYWANMQNEEITEADLNDTVKLIFSSPTSEGGNVNFEVWKNIPFWFDSEVAGSTGAWTTWNATESGTFYFRATVNSQTKISENLAVSSTTDDDPFELTLMSPVCGTDILKGDSLIVTVRATDEDDLITGFIDFGDGQMQAITNGLTSVTHTFNTAGNIQIMANGTNSKGELKRDISNIMVIDPDVNGHYLAACIDEPEDLSNLLDRIVIFNSTSTRGIDFVSATQTRNEISKSGMSFKWAYSDENISPAGEELEASSIKYHTYSGLNSTAYLFEREFALAGNNWATLEVELI